MKNCLKTLMIALYVGLLRCYSIPSCSDTLNKIGCDVVQTQTNPSPISDVTSKLPNNQEIIIACMLLLIKTSSAINTLRTKANKNIRLKGSNVHFLTLKLQGKGSTFLKEFYQSIDPLKRTIDHKKLMNHQNSTFAFGFRQLIDQLTNPSLDYIKYSHIDDICYVSEKGYFVLVDWMKTQIIDQYELETQIFDFGILERTVKFELPSQS